jgi:hypothetical protein
MRLDLPALLVPVHVHGVNLEVSALPRKKCVLDLLTRCFFVRSCLTSTFCPGGDDADAFAERNADREHAPIGGDVETGTSRKKQ